MIAKRAEPGGRPPVPVYLPGDVVKRLPSGRVRTLILPVRFFGKLRRADMLWVGEPVVIETRQPRPGFVLVRYFGMTRGVPVPWPRALARPFAGPRLASAMPVELSRFTLRVISAETKWLCAVTNAEATESGAEAVEGGWCPRGADPECFVPYKRGWEAVAHDFGRAHGSADASEGSDVVVVRFEAIARNVCDVVPGMGSGGARR